MTRCWTAALALSLVVMTGTVPVMAQQLDKLSRARIAATEGDHATCAKLADEARRQPNTIWRAHQVFAACEVYDADDKRAEIGDAAWAKRINNAIGALRLLLQTPGLLVMQEQRSSVEFIVEELLKKVASADKTRTDP